MWVALCMYVYVHIRKQNKGQRKTLCCRLHKQCIKRHTKRLEEGVKACIFNPTERMYVKECDENKMSSSFS